MRHALYLEILEAVALFLATLLSACVLTLLLRDGPAAEPERDGDDGQR